MARDGKSATMSYLSVPDAALDDPEALKDWAALAFAAAARGGKAKKR